MEKHRDEHEVSKEDNDSNEKNTTTPRDVIEDETKDDDGTMQRSDHVQQKAGAQGQTNLTTTTKLQ